MGKRKALKALDRNALPRLPRPDSDNDISQSWEKLAASSSKTPKISNRGGPSTPTTSHSKPHKSRPGNDDRNKLFVTTRRKRAVVQYSPLLVPRSSDDEQSLVTQPPSVTHSRDETKSSFVSPKDTRILQDDEPTETPGAKSMESRQDLGPKTTNKVNIDPKNANDPEELAATAALSDPYDFKNAGEQRSEKSKSDVSDDGMCCVSHSDSSLDMDSSSEKDDIEAARDEKIGSLEDDTLLESQQSNAKKSLRKCAAQGSAKIGNSLVEPKRKTDGSSATNFNSALPARNSSPSILTKEYLAKLKSRPPDDESVFRRVNSSGVKKGDTSEHSRFLGSTIGGSDCAESLDGSEVSILTLKELEKQNYARLALLSAPQSLQRQPKLCNQDRKEVRQQQQRASFGKFSNSSRFNICLQSDTSIEEWSIADDSASVPIVFALDKKKYRHPPLPPGWKINISKSRKQPFYTHPDYGTSWYCPVILPCKPAAVVHNRTQRHGKKMALDKDNNIEFAPAESKVVAVTSLKGHEDMATLVDRYLEQLDDEGYDGSQSSACSSRASTDTNASAVCDVREDSEEGRRLGSLHCEVSSAQHLATLHNSIHIPMGKTSKGSRKCIEHRILSPIKEDTESLTKRPDSRVPTTSQVSIGSRTKDSFVDKHCSPADVCGIRDESDRAGPTSDLPRTQCTGPEILELSRSDSNISLTPQNVIQELAIVHYSAKSSSKRNGRPGKISIPVHETLEDSSHLDCLRHGSDAVPEEDQQSRSKAHQSAAMSKVQPLLDTNETPLSAVAQTKQSKLGVEDVLSTKTSKVELTEETRDDILRSAKWTTPINCGQSFILETERCTHYKVVGSLAHSCRNRVNSSERVSLIQDSKENPRNRKSARKGCRKLSSRRRSTSNVDELLTAGTPRKRSRAQFHEKVMDDSNISPGATSTHSGEPFDDEWSPPRRTVLHSPSVNAIDAKPSPAGDDFFDTRHDSKPGIPDDEDWKSPGFSGIEAGSVDDSCASPLRIDMKEPADSGASNILCCKQQAGRTDRKREGGTGANLQVLRRSSSIDHVQNTALSSPSPRSVVSTPNSSTISTHGDEEFDASTTSPKRMDSSTSLRSFVSTPKSSTSRPTHDEEFDMPTMSPKSMDSPTSLRSVVSTPKCNPIPTHDGEEFGVPTMSPKSMDSHISDLTDFNQNVDDVGDTSREDFRNTSFSADEQYDGTPLSVVASPPQTKRLHHCMSSRVLNPPHPVCSLQNLEALARRQENSKAKQKRKSRPKRSIQTISKRNERNIVVKNRRPGRK